MTTDMLVSEVTCTLCRSTIPVLPNESFAGVMDRHKWDRHSVYAADDCEQRQVFCVECRLWLQSDDVFRGAADLVEHLVTIHGWASPGVGK